MPNWMGEFVSEVLGPSGVQSGFRRSARIGTALGQRVKVTLTASTFTSLSIPTGAVGAIFELGTAVSLTLKGVTGDTGWPLVGSTVRLDFAVVPVTGTTGGITSAHGSDQTIYVTFI